MLFVYIIIIVTFIVQKIFKIIDVISTIKVVVSHFLEIICLTLCHNFFLIFVNSLDYILLFSALDAFIACPVFHFSMQK